jgi:DNA-binding MarR family transcriptional regulator
MSDCERDLIDQLISDWRRERPETQPEPMRIVGRIVRLGRRYEEEASRLLRPHGLTYSDFDVLATLRRSGEPYELSPTQLQRNVLLSSGAMTACLRRLESLGLITRQADAADRRRLSARLSGAGHELVEALIDERFAVAQNAVDTLSAAQVGQLETLLRALASPCTSSK